MKKNTLSILLIIIAILVTISIYITNNSESNRSEDQSTGQKIVPKLYDQLNDVTSIKITNSTGNIIINKSDNTDIGWTVKTKDNYPGNVVQIRKTLIDLAELEKVEAKTKKDKNYAKLGVQALTEGKLAPGTQTTFIEINKNTDTIASILIGNKKSGHTSGASGIKQLNYVRLSKDPQVWLVAGNLNLPALKNFMNTEITNIAVARIQKVEITHAKGSHITISKKTKTDKEFTLKQLTKNKELVSPVILGSLASSLQNLSFDDVLLKNNKKTFKKPVNIEFTTFNGLTINVYVAQADKKSYLWLNAKSTKPTTASLKKEDVENKDKAPDPEAEAADINKRHSNWLYSIPTQKAELLTKQVKDLVKTKEKKVKAKSK